MLFFFFKQKTAYEMRISDWSSDVCSSDLRAPCIARRPPPRPSQRRRQPRAEFQRRDSHRDPRVRAAGGGGGPAAGAGAPAADDRAPRAVAGQGHQDRPHPLRSEEHTSELQSLMRISYAVFCLKKKKK